MRAAVAATLLAACGSKAQTPQQSEPSPSPQVAVAGPVAVPREAEPPAPDEPLTEAHYAKLFVKDTCFRYRAVHREQMWEEDGPQIKDQSKVAEIRCCVAEGRQFGQAAAARVQCTWPKGWSERDLVGNPPINPIIPAARVYVATPKGLWWAADLPASDAEVTRITNDPQMRLLALPGEELFDKNTEDEDVSYTASVERDDEGRWCWEQTERDDYKITEILCFANGTMVRSLRLHDVDDDLDTTTLDLIE
jgi:hypothetical protein